MRQSAVAPPAALLEREHEVERIGVALGEVAEGAGRAVAIEAPAGMGKSRLLEDARGRAAELGFRVLAARATELEQGFPYGVMRQLFERPLTDADAGGGGRRGGGGGGRAGGGGGGGPPRAAPPARRGAGAAALAADVLTGAPGGDPGYALQHGLYWLACNVATDAPLALLVDDLQWCDALSASALGFTARRLDGQPVALILATRPLDPEL